MKALPVFQPPPPLGLPPFFVLPFALPLLAGSVVRVFSERKSTSCLLTKLGAVPLVKKVFTATVSAVSAVSVVAPSVVSDSSKEIDDGESSESSVLVDISDKDETDESSESAEGSDGTEMLLLAVDVDTDIVDSSV